MDNLEIRSQDSLVKKENMVKLVHDVADMEVRAFTMREAAKGCREAAEKKENEAKRLVGSANVKVERLESERKTRLQDKSKVDSFAKHFKDSITGWGIFGGFILQTIIWEVPGGILSSSIFTENGGFDLTMYLFVVAVIELALMIIWLSVKKNSHKKDFEYASKKLKESENALVEAKKSLSKAETDLDEAVIVASELCKRADELDSAADMIGEKLKVCYSLGIIQHSYQNLVCVVVIDAIFINDKADTMREAMLLCDTELRHYELMNKLDDIYHSLRALAMSMKRMGEILNSIDAGVSRIGDEVVSMAKSQDRIAYATESIKRSADNADFYIAQKRAGSL